MSNADSIIIIYTCDYLYIKNKMLHPWLTPYLDVTSQFIEENKLSLVYYRNEDHLCLLIQYTYFKINMYIIC